MTIQEIINKLYEKKREAKDSTIKERLDNICNLLKTMPYFDIAEKIPEIDIYLNDKVSLLDGDILKTILDKLKEQISAVESDNIDSINKHKRRLLNIFLIIVAAFAAGALVFTVLNLIYGESYLNGWFGRIAGAFGTLDFALGALGFILERKEDLKKGELQNAAQTARVTYDAKEFKSVVNSFNNNKISIKCNKRG